MNTCLLFNKIRESVCKSIDICKDTKHGYKGKDCETILKPKQVSQSLKLHEDYYRRRFYINHFKWSTERKKLFTLTFPKDFLKLFYILSLALEYKIKQGKDVYSLEEKLWPT